MTLFMTLVMQGTLAGTVAVLAVRCCRNSAPAIRMGILALGLAAFVVPLSRGSAIAVQTGSGAFPAISLVIAAGILWSMARLALEAMTLRRILREAAIAPVALQQRLIALAGVTGDGSPLLLISRKVLVPFSTRSAIVVPPSLLFASDEQLSCVLLHELGHVRFRDVFTYRLLAILESIYWFHPMLRSMNRSMRQAVEERCDDFVLRHEGVEPRHYAETLVELAAGLTAAPPFPTAAMASPEVESLARRVRRISASRCPRRPPLMLLMAVPLIAAAAFAAPRVTSFAGQSGAHAHQHVHLH